MASILTIIRFTIYYLWAVSKQTMGLITISWILYLVDFNEDFRGFLSANLFAINSILIYFLFMKDKYLELNGFYMLNNISTIRVFLSKLVLLGTVFILHLSLYLFITLNINLHLYITLISIVFLAVLSKLIFFNVSGKMCRIGYFVLLTILFLIGYRNSNITTSLIMLCFLIFYLFLTIRDLLKMTQIKENGGTYLF